MPSPIPKAVPRHQEFHADIDTYDSRTVGHLAIDLGYQDTFGHCPVAVTVGQSVAVLTPTMTNELGRALLQVNSDSARAARSVGG
jgi:hypothetical protein